MANSYTTEAKVESWVGANLMTALLDRDRDDTRDSGVFDAVEGAVKAEIDARLRKQYQVPFADVSASPATPELVQTIAEHLVLYNLFAWFNEQDEAAQYHLNKAEDLLNGLIPDDEGRVRYELDASLKAADQRSPVFANKRTDATFGGVDDNDDPRMESW